MAHFTIDNYSLRACSVVEDTAIHQFKIITRMCQGPFGGTRFMLISPDTRVRTVFQRERKWSLTCVQIHVLAPGNENWMKCAILLSVTEQIFIWFLCIYYSLSVLKTNFESKINHAGSRLSHLLARPKRYSLRRDSSRKRSWRPSPSAAHSHLVFAVLVHILELFQSLDSRDVVTKIDIEMVWSIIVEQSKRLSKSPSNHS